MKCIYCKNKLFGLVQITQRLLKFVLEEIFSWHDSIEYQRFGQEQAMVIVVVVVSVIGNMKYGLRLF